MTALPSETLLRDSIGQTYRLSAAGGHTLDLRLADVYCHTPMNDQYTCYSALFQLPAGSVVTQGTYRIEGAQGQAWELFLSPVAADASGAPQLEAVFHYRIMEPA